MEGGADSETVDETAPLKALSHSNEDLREVECRMMSGHGRVHVKKKEENG